MRVESDGAPAQDDDGAPRPQHLIVTLFALYGRSRNRTIAIAHLISLMSHLGIDSNAVRSSVSRLKSRGLLVSDRSNSAAAYRLDESLEDMFASGDHRIFHRQRAEMGDPWLLASFTVPESERPVRHQLRRLLTRQGFGQVVGGLWIAPAVIVNETRTALQRAGLESYVELFEGTRISNEPLQDAVRRWWDLAALEKLYSDFIRSHQHFLARPLEDGPAFSVYIHAVTQWRRLPYLDPGIPLALLPSRWAAIEAENLFDKLSTELAPSAERFVASLLDA